MSDTNTPIQKRFKKLLALAGWTAVVSVGACRPSPTTSGQDAAVRVLVDPARGQVDVQQTVGAAGRDPCTLVRADVSGMDLLELAFEEGELSLTQRRACVVAGANESLARRRAREFALARRLPSAELAGWWDSVESANRSWMLRALAGRQRTLSALLPPRQWNIERTQLASYGTIVSRFRIAEGIAPAIVDEELRRGLFAATLEVQLAAARRLRMAHWIPTVDELAMLSPLVVPSVAKSLADRDDAAQVPWRLWAERMLPRARVAPRLWGNAWRAFRDGIPKTVRTATELPLWMTLVTSAPVVTGLSDETQAWFTCEDALALDRWHNRVEHTRTCASGPLGWISAIAQARVLAEMTDSDVQRCFLVL